MVQYILADSSFPSSMWRELFMGAAYLRNRTPHKALKTETLFDMLDGDKPTSRAFAPSELEPSRTPRTPGSSTPRPGKGSCIAIARRANLTESGTQRLAASWRAGTSSSLRHRRTCFPAFTNLFVARSGAAVVVSRRRHSGQRLHLERRLPAGCKGLHRCSRLHRHHFR